MKVGVPPSSRTDSIGLLGGVRTPQKFAQIDCRFSLYCPSEMSTADLERLAQDGVSVNRRLSVYKHRKKAAATDAQLLMNRIALLQKEEERARKKVNNTKGRAVEILSMREENFAKIKVFSEVLGKREEIQQEMQKKNKDQEAESRRNRQIQAKIIQEQKSGNEYNARSEAPAFEKCDKREGVRHKEKAEAERGCGACRRRSAT